MATINSPFAVDGQGDPGSDDPRCAQPGAVVHVDANPAVLALHIERRPNETRDAASCRRRWRRRDSGLRSTGGARATRRQRRLDAAPVCRVDEVATATREPSSAITSGGARSRAGNRRCVQPTRQPSAIGSATYRERDRVVDRAHVDDERPARRRTRSPSRSSETRSFGRWTRSSPTWPASRCHSRGGMESDLARRRRVGPRVCETTPVRRRHHVPHAVALHERRALDGEHEAVRQRVVLDAARILDHEQRSPVGAQRPAYPRRHAMCPTVHTRDRHGDARAVRDAIRSRPARARRPRRPSPRARERAVARHEHVHRPSPGLGRSRAPTLRPTPRDRASPRAPPPRRSRRRSARGSACPVSRRRRAWTSVHTRRARPLIARDSPAVPIAGAPARSAPPATRERACGPSRPTA